MKTCKKCEEQKELKYFEKSTKTSYRATCKRCRQLARVTRDRTVPGVIRVMYNSQVGSSKHRQHDLPDYTLKELSTFLMKDSIFLTIYNDWKKQDYPLWEKPSCDRLDNALPYRLNNLEVVTWGENQSRGCEDLKNGVIIQRSKKVMQISKDGIEIAVHHSTQAAARSLGIVNGSRIAAVARGVIGRHTAYGYKWQYVETKTIKGE